MHATEDTELWLSRDHPPSPYTARKRLAYIMVDHIPEDGATIIVMSHEVGLALKKMIKDRRGIALARRCKMISMHNETSASKIQGLNGVVIIDPSIAIFAKAEIFEAIYKAVAPIWAMQAPEMKEVA